MAHLSVKTSPELTPRITNRMQRDKKPTLSEYERHRYKSKTYGNVVIYTSGKLVCMGSEEQVDRFRDHFYEPSVDDHSTEKKDRPAEHRRGGSCLREAPLQCDRHR